MHKKFQTRTLLSCGTSVWHDLYAFEDGGSLFLVWCARVCVAHKQTHCEFVLTKLFAIKLLVSSFKQIIRNTKQRKDFWYFIESWVVRCQRKRWPKSSLSFNAMIFNFWLLIWLVFMKIWKVKQQQWLGMYHLSLITIAHSARSIEMNMKEKRKNKKSKSKSMCTNEDVPELLYHNMYVYNFQCAWCTNGIDKIQTKTVWQCLE